MRPKFWSMWRDKDSHRRGNKTKKEADKPNQRKLKMKTMRSRRFQRKISLSWTGFHMWWEPSSMTRNVCQEAVTAWLQSTNWGQTKTSMAWIQPLHDHLQTGSTLDLQSPLGPELPLKTIWSYSTMISWTHVSQTVLKDAGRSRSTPSKELLLFAALSGPATLPSTNSIAAC